MKNLFYLLILLIVCTPNVMAEKLTAICKDPEGWSAYFKKNTSPEIETDRMKDTIQTYTWELGSDIADIVMQDIASLGGSPSSHKAIVIPISKKQIVFLIKNIDSLEMHTMFTDLGKVVINYSYDLSFRLPQKIPSVITNKVLFANCKVTINK